MKKGFHEKLWLIELTYRKCKYCRFSKIFEGQSFRWFVWISEFSVSKSLTNRVKRIESFYSRSYIARVQIDGFDFSIDIMHKRIYENTDYLQIECFEFFFLSLNQKELHDIKDYWNNHPSNYSAEQMSLVKKTNIPESFCS